MNSHPLSLSDAIPRHIIFETKPQYCHPVALRATDAAATLTRALHTLRAAESRGDKSLPTERDLILYAAWAARFASPALVRPRHYDTHK
jgi:hypothetical protein